MKKITNVILPLALVLTLCIVLLPANRIQAAEDPSQANTGSGMSVSGISLKNMYRGIEISWNAVSGAVSLKMKQTEENVKLLWNEYPNASGYQIYRGVNDSRYVFYKETTEKEFTESMKDAYIYDDIETDYVGKRCYKVRPYYNDGVSIWYGAFSSSKMVN